MTAQGSTPGEQHPPVSPIAGHEAPAGRKSTLAILVVGALVVVGGYVGLSTFQNSRIVAVGDCIEEFDSSDARSSAGRRGRGGGSDGPRKVDCGDPDAHKVVLGERQIDDTDGSCIDIDGVDSEVTTTVPDLRRLCLGPVGVDPALSVNTITEGECALIEEDQARRSDCAEPDAMRVLTVLNDISLVPDPLAGPMAQCENAGVDNAEVFYTWGLGGEYTSRLSAERGICLAPEGVA